MDLDLPAFTPVSTAQRHDGWTPDRQQQFIAALAQLGGVAAACRAVGMSAKSAYRLRARPDATEFAAAWDDALAMGRDRAFDRAIDRGLNGYTRPVRYRGRVVAQRHCYDNRLLYAACYGEPMRALPTPGKGG